MKQEQKPKTAVALHYDGNNAPRVVASGKGDIAEQIIALAREHGIPLEEDGELLDLLSQLELGDEIPQPLYQAVAEIIAFAYMLRGMVPEGFDETAQSQD